MIGIYKIINPNNKVYIGQSTNIERRFKQYKSLDAIRKILVYKPEMFSKDNYMTSLIVDEVVNLTCSLRSLLVRNALTTLSEIFQSDTINLKDKYENLFKKIIKRLNDKNTFIKEASNYYSSYVN